MKIAELFQTTQSTNITEAQYEMMFSNGKVKKFVAKDDKDAKRIADGLGAKSVIKLKGGMPAGKITEGKMKQETAAQAFARYEQLKKSKADPAMLAKVLDLANSLMDAQFKKTQQNLEAKFAGADWWQEVKKMYKLKEQGNKWIIISNARDWKQTKDWEFDTKYEALEQLEKLVKYKAADRKAGKGDVDKDFERVEMLRKRETSMTESKAKQFFATDVSHEPDGVMVLVRGSTSDMDDETFKNYYGINVVFGKGGKVKDLVSNDKISDEDVKKYRNEIIAVAKKELGKDEMKHLNSL